MDEHVSSHQDQEHIQIIEIGRLDDVVAEFPTEGSLLTVAPNASAPGESYHLDELPGESLAVPGDAIAESIQEVQSEVSAPMQVAAAHRRGPSRFAVAALAIIGVLTGFGLGAFIGAQPPSRRPSVTRASDAVLSAETVTPAPSATPVESLAPALETQVSPPALDTQVSPPPRSPETPQRPAAQPSARVVEPSGRTMATAVPAPAIAPAIAAASAIPAPVINSPTVGTPPRTPDNVGGSLPVGTAGAAAVAAERPAAAPGAEANIVAAERRPPVAPVVTPYSAIQHALTQYQQAFSQLDVAAVRQVWPSVDGKALARAFDQLHQENVTFDSCDLTISGRTAVASCGGATRYVPKVGNKGERVQRQQWQFSLHQGTDAWLIDTVDVVPQ